MCIRDRNEYAKLKKALAQKFPYDIEGYCDGKDVFVRETEKRALSQYDGTWDKLYIAARKAQQEREISPLITAGGVSAALLTEQGNIYVGVCIDTACSLGTVSYTHLCPAQSFAFHYEKAILNPERKIICRCLRLPLKKRGSAWTSS